MALVSTSAALSLPSFAERYRDRFPIGAAVEPVTLEQDGELVLRHFNRLVAENAMKWGELCRNSPEYDFTRADKIADFARRHGLGLTGHTLLWHQMQPNWLFRRGDGDVSPSELAERLRSHIFRMVERYADVVDNWDVVNEAVSETPGKLYRDGSEGSAWYRIFGSEEYVHLAFRFASEAKQAHAPQVALYYNDYNIERRDKREKTLELVRSLRARGLTIDGVGIQGHINLVWPTPEELRASIEEFARADLLVKISELDVSVYTEDQSDEKRFQPELELDAKLEERLAARYREIFDVFSDQAKHLTSVTFWGVADDRTWLNYFPTDRKNYPLLLGHRREPKRAMYELLGLPWEPRATASSAR
ncbi:MAG: endo-1,4-beta-xylanase [Polyangiaceae bacterium]